jgi:hypothetical protein
MLMGSSSYEDQHNAVLALFTETTNRSRDLDVVGSLVSRGIDRVEELQWIL